MKKAALLLTAYLLISALSGYSQRYLPFASSNYAGVTGVYLQPASIADSRYKFDLTCFGIESTFNNNYLGMDPYYFWHPTETDFDDPEEFKNNYVTENGSDVDKSLLLNLQLEAFSFMATVSNKAAIALTLGPRVFFNVDNVSSGLAKILYESNDYTDLLNKELFEANASIQANVWSELGFTYSRVLFEKGRISSRLAQP